MKRNDYNEEFEEYWKVNGRLLQNVAPKVLRDERENSGKMNTAGDWLLFIVPFVVGVGFMNLHFVHSEMLNLIVGLVIVVVCFCVTTLIKPYVTGKRSVVDIDSDIKEHFHAVYIEKGLSALDAEIGKGGV